MPIYRREVIKSITTHPAGWNYWCDAEAHYGREFAFSVITPRYPAERMDIADWLDDQGFDSYFFTDYARGHAIFFNDEQAAIACELAWG